MQETNNTYYQQPEDRQMMPPPEPWMMPPGMMPRRKKRTWKEKLMTNYGGGMDGALTKKDLRVPNWMVTNSVVFFFIAYALCRMAFGYPYPVAMVAVMCASVLLFFYGISSCARSWTRYRERSFLKNVFWTGFIVRFIWVCYSYFIFNPEFYGTPVGSMADAGWYMDFGHKIAEWVRNGFPESFSGMLKRNHTAIDDTAYPIWLAIINLVTFDVSDIFIPYVLKCLMGAYCAISMYRVAKRHFGVSTARMAALFCMLNPNMIYWCGTMMKEAEMVFLCCLFIEKTDYTLSTSNKLGFKELIPGLLIGMVLMFFRAALGLLAFLAIFAHIVFVSQKVMSNGKKILAGVLVAATLFVGLGDQFMSQAKEHIESVESGGQKTNMEWRAERKGGNSFAKYAGATVFAPLIFTIPFPTFNQAEADQIVQVLTAGGSYIRNVLSFFVILVLILVLISGEWRKHVFILAFTVGYLAVLVFSGFAQSGRFHMPVWPMIMLLAAYGIQVLKDNKRIKWQYNIVLMLEVVVCLAWNWFKLKGRGMI